MTNKELKEVFCKNLNELIDHLPSQITRQDVARNCGISMEALTSYLRGKYMPEITALMKLAEYFCLSMDELLGREARCGSFYMDFNTIVEKSYEKYLGTCNNHSMYTLMNYEGGRNKQGGPYCATWPYNLLDAIQHYNTKSDFLNEEIINYPITQIQKEALDYCIEHYLTEREQKCIFAQFKEDLTFEEIGKRYGVGRERIRQINAKTIRKLRHPSRFNLIRYGLGRLVTNEKQRQVELLEHELSDKVFELEIRTAAINREIESLDEECPDICEADYQKVTKHGYMNTAVADMELSVRTYNCLNRAGCATVSDVISKIEDGSIIKIRNLGRRSCSEIANKLIDMGYSSKATMLLAAN